jgi:Ca2+-binding RTX toxin-like protein
MRRPIVERRGFAVQRITRSMTVAFVVGLLWPLVAAVPASAAPCGDGSVGDPESIYLFDAEGWPWDLDADGGIDNGLSDAFDDYATVVVGGADYPDATANTCATEEGGREVVYPEETLSGLEVSRKVYITAAGEGFARFLTVLRNAGAAPVSTSYIFGGNLGSDSSTDVEVTSNGDGLATTADRWAISDDTDPTDPTSEQSDPPVVTMWDGVPPGAAQTAGTVTFVDGDDDVEIEYPVTVPPGGTFVFLHVVAQRAGIPQATALASRLQAGAPDVFVGMSAAELSQLRNFAVPTCRGKAGSLFGTSGGDALTGTTGADVVLAGEGDDVVSTLGGNDIVCAGAGNDGVNAGGGKDQVAGEDGRDKLKGAGGNDLLLGGPDNDVLNGGPGKRDVCKGGPGTDKAKACEKGKA